MNKQNFIKWSNFLQGNCPVDENRGYVKFREQSGYRKFISWN